MIVLSLFDGISCGQIAFERLGITFDGVSNKYIASEIKKIAIQTTQLHYPNTIQVGDICKLHYDSETNALYKNCDIHDNKYYHGTKVCDGKPDIIIGGSPCQDLSSMGSRKGLMGDKSKLFFEYTRLLKEIKPKYFLLENNYSMTQDNRSAISQYLGCDPIYINSSDFSAQNRKRLYWTNISVGKHSIKDITLGDIAQHPSEKQDYIFTKYDMYMSKEYDGRKIQKNIKRKIKTTKDKSPTLGVACGTYGNNTGYILKQDGKLYTPTPIECERLQTLPDNYTANLSKTNRFNVIGDGWTVDVVKHIFSFIPWEEMNVEMDLEISG